MAANNRIDRRKTALNNLKDLISLKLPDINLDDITIGPPLDNDLDNKDRKNTKVLLVNKPGKTPFTKPTYFCYNRLPLTTVIKEEKRNVTLTIPKGEQKTDEQLQKEFMDALPIVEDSLGMSWPSLITPQTPYPVEINSYDSYLYIGRVTATLTVNRSKGK